MTSHSYIKIFLSLSMALLSALSASAMSIEEARQAAAKGNTDAMLELARLALKAYRFDEAIDAIGKYNAKGKSSSEAESIKIRAQHGKSMLDRVENIQVIDSINVDADAFFAAFNLSAPTGKLADSEIVNSALSNDWRAEHPDVIVASPVFVNESGERMLWTTTGGDHASNTTIWELESLADGTWDTPRALFDYATIFDGDDSGVSLFAPFLMSDGVTLYFGAEGDASLGGYDIFITRRDDDNTFLQPQNIGMPYNSPSNDYMYAIDELTGIGWWATDRNNIPGKVTIYRFVPSDLRVNYSPDTPGLIGLASLSSGVAATHPQGADYTTLLAALPAANAQSSADEPDFTFAIQGKIYTSLDDFRNDSARRLMESYLDYADEYDLDRQDLDRLRIKYRKGDKSVRQQIIQLEKSQEEGRLRLRSMANEIIRCELGNKIK